MDILPANGAWIALGAVLVAALLAGAGLLLLRRGTSAPSPDPPEDRRDDLAEFLAHPPGTPGARPRTGEGWAVLGPPVGVRDPAPVERPRTSQRHGVRAGGAVAALALLAVAVVAVALAEKHGADGGRERDGRHRASQSATAGRPEQLLAEARLTFEGLVLEPHAVGVTATYPELRLTGTGDRLRAHLELPTWNCLTGEAPADPVAAGCRRTVPEVAELAEPEMDVIGTGDGFRVTGRFATATRPNGSGPAPTGRTYELDVTVEAAGRPGTGWLPAQGVLRLGTDRAESTGTDLAARVNVLRYQER